MKNLSKKEIVWIAVLAVLVVLSMTVLRGIVTSPRLYTGTLRILDEQKREALALSVSLTAASVAVPMLSGLSLPLFLIVVIIYMEELLLTAFGALASVIVLPFGLLVIMAYIVCKKGCLVNWAKRALILALALLVVIPASAMVTKQIKSTVVLHKEMKLQAMKEKADESEEENDERGLNAILSDLADGVSDAVSFGKNAFDVAVDTVAALFITSFVVPLVSLWVFIQVIRYAMRTNITMDRMMKLLPSRKQSRRRKSAQGALEVPTNAGKSVRRALEKSKDAEQ